MENTKHLDHFTEILSPICPSNSEIIPEGEGDSIIRISWPMPEPEERTKKRSRPIHIGFLSDLLSDYNGLGPISRKRFDSRLIDYIQHKFNNFITAHDKPITTSFPKPERWVVPLALFG